MKKWAGQEGINDARVGYLNNYALVLMVLHYLQAGLEQPLLPNLHKVCPEMFTKQNNPRSLQYDDDSILELVKQSENQNSLAELLIGFMLYFAKFNWSKEWISIVAGKRQSREDSLDPTCERFFMYIEDPFEEKNVARCVLKTSDFQRIFGAFKSACDKLIHNPCLSVLDV